MRFYETTELSGGQKGKDQQTYIRLRIIIIVSELESSRHLFQSPLYRAARGPLDNDYLNILRSCDTKVRLNIETDIHMHDIETPQHLYQQPLYKDINGRWHVDFRDAVQGCQGRVHLDVVAVASVLSFGMVGLDRTLLKEISRRPWMSEVSNQEDARLSLLPCHGFSIASDDLIAKRLYKLLCDEARRVCSGFKSIYILLSGGLDSRIVAGILSDLYHAGDILVKPIAVTWGLSDSRDVFYARRIAEILDFDWLNVGFGPETVLQNIQTTARHLGLLHSPELLHHMSWFSNVPSNSLVIAGSFGDSIGRAEFAGIRLLQLLEKKPQNTYELLDNSVFEAAKRVLQHDIDKIRLRGGADAPEYAKNEYWMHGFRMRGGLCHALSLINRYATIYQMFTDPAVYGFMWSLHPTRRDDSIYAQLLTKKFPRIASVPWPRTNKALRGPTDGAMRGLRPHYHEYTKWSSGPLYKELSQRIDPDWFAASGIFNPKKIERIRELVRFSQERVGRLNDIWLWLAGFRTFVEEIELVYGPMVIEAEREIPKLEKRTDGSSIRAIGLMAASKSMTFNSICKTIRSYKRSIEIARLARKAIQKYPPVYIDNENDI